MLIDLHVRVAALAHLTLGYSCRSRLRRRTRAPRRVSDNTHSGSFAPCSRRRRQAECNRCCRRRPIHRRPLDWCRRRIQLRPCRTGYRPADSPGRSYCHRSSRSGTPSRCRRRYCRHRLARPGRGKCRHSHHPHRPCRRNRECSTSSRGRSAPRYNRCRRSTGPRSNCRRCSTVVWSSGRYHSTLSSPRDKSRGSRPRGNSPGTTASGVRRDPKRCSIPRRIRRPALGPGLVGNIRTCNIRRDRRFPVHSR
jgi:hypothetical protein